MNLYERMQRQSTKGPSNRRTYSFEGAPEPQQKSTGRFRARSTQKKEVREPDPAARFRAPRNHELARRSESTPVRRESRGNVTYLVDDTDRPYAYGPPEVYEEAEVYRKPEVSTILADLGLRMLEVAIAAVASEIAYFFTRRRFYGRR